MDLKFNELTSPNLLTEEQLAALLPQLDGLASWIKQVQEFALNKALSGSPIEGYKVVEGKSNRKWTDDADVADALKLEGYEDAFIYNKSVKGITDLEKLLGKKDFEKILGSYVIKPAGKPALVPVTDKRPVYDANAQAAADFKD